MAIIIAFNCAAFATMAEDSCIDYVDASILKSNPNNRYFIGLLETALQTTRNEFGEYQLCPRDIPITQSRQLLELNKGRIDVFWSVATSERMKEALMVPSPLIMGAYGLRVLVVNDSIQLPLSEQALRDKTFLVGRDWPDKAIYEHNGFKVAYTDNEDDYYKLVAMDPELVYPRGITEAWSESALHTGLKIKVEPSLLLQFPVSVHFFVALNNSVLVKRIEKGLNNLFRDTSSESLFRQFPLHQIMLQQAELGSRTIIVLNNPDVRDEESIINISAMQAKLIQ